MYFCVTAQVEDTKMPDDRSLRSLNSALRDIRRGIDQLNRKMDLLLEQYRKPSNALSANNRSKLGVEVEKATSDGFDVVTLLSLPDHLRKTAMTLCRLGRASAEDVARETHRARAAESDYLNQLVSMGHLRKRRSGRTVYFFTQPQNDLSGGV
jgi:hypothetical protein